MNGGAALTEDSIELLHRAAEREAAESRSLNDEAPLLSVPTHMGTSGGRGRHDSAATTGRRTAEDVDSVGESSETSSDSSDEDRAGPGSDFALLNDDEKDFDVLADVNFDTVEDSIMRTAAQPADVPSPLGNTVQSKSKVAQAGFIVERLKDNQHVYDEKVFFLCKKYHLMHRKEHDGLKKRHARAREYNLLKGLTPRERLNLIFDQPQKTWMGRAVAFVEFLLVCVTLGQLLYESQANYNPDIQPSYSRLWMWLEGGITVTFTVESISRCALSFDRVKWIKSPLNVMDIFAVLPFYLSLFLSGSSFDFLKVLRLARFFKVFRSFSQIESLVTTQSRIAASLVAPFAFLGVSVLVIANMVYYAEGGFYNPAPERGITMVPPSPPQCTPGEQFANCSVPTFAPPLAVNASNGSTLLVASLLLTPDQYMASPFNKFLLEDCDCTSSAAYLLGVRNCTDKPSKFESSLQAIWFSIISMTTVGYGTRFYVQCAAGKAIMSFGLFLSTVFLAMPIAIVGNSFTETVEESKVEADRRKIVNARNIKLMRLNDAADMEKRKKKRKEARREKKKEDRAVKEGLIRAQMLESAGLSDPDSDAKREAARRKKAAKRLEASRRKSGKKSKYGDSGYDLIDEEMKEVPEKKGKLRDKASKIIDTVERTLEETKATISNAGLQVMDERAKDLSAKLEAPEYNRHEQVTVESAGQALFLHLANTLQMRYFNFADVATAAELSETRAEERDMTTEQAIFTSLGQQQAEAESVKVIENDNERKVKQKLPSLVVHHIDTFLSQQLQLWVSQWIEEQVRLLKDPHKAAQLLAKQQGGKGSSSKRIRELQRKSAAAIDENITFTVTRLKEIQRAMASSTWFNRLQSVDFISGFAAEVAISRLLTYDVVAIKDDSAPERSFHGDSVDANSSAALGSAGSVKKQKRNGSATLSECPTLYRHANPTINLFCPELVMPQQIARIHVHYAFAKRIVRLHPMCPSANTILVNGRPIDELAMEQGAQQLGAFAVMQSSSWPQSTYVGNQNSQPLSIDERHAGVVLQDGDEINFTPVILMWRDYTGRSASTNYGKAGRPAAAARVLSGETISVDDLRADYGNRIEELKMSGVEEVKYRVRMPGSNSAQVLMELERQQQEDMEKAALEAIMDPESEKLLKLGVFGTRARGNATSELSAASPQKSDTSGRQSEVSSDKSSMVGGGRQRQSASLGGGSRQHTIGSRRPSQEPRSPSIPPSSPQIAAASDSAINDMIAAREAPKKNVSHQRRTRARQDSMAPSAAPVMDASGLTQNRRQSQISQLAQKRGEVPSSPTTTASSSSPKSGGRKRR